MVKGIVSGVLAFGLVIATWILFVLPWTYDTIYGLFEQGSDIATIVALAVSAGVALFGVQLAILLSVLLGTVVFAFLDE